jgi:NADPH:quinone reductase-like Zn-dependent oxidoreductase
VTEVAAGDRVAYAGGPLGAYAEERVVLADRLVVLPDDISDIQAAANDAERPDHPISDPTSFQGHARRYCPIDLGIFGQKGSLFFTRPTLNTYAAKRTDLLTMAKELFEVVRSGAVKIEVNQTYSLKDAAQAHRDPNSRVTIGSTVLTV